MNDIIIQFTTILNAINDNIAFTLSIITLFFIVHFVNFLLSYRLIIFGIYPRSIHGLIGIFVSPFLHGDFNHLFFNAIPLFVLMNLVLLQGKITFFYVSFIIILLSGLCVWLIGRKAMHIGASSLVLGYWSFLLKSIFSQGAAMAIILGIVCIYYFGGLVGDLIPGKKETSWEGHLAGFLSGIAASYICASGILT